MKIENKIGYKFTVTQRDDRGNLNLSAESAWRYFREQVNFFRCIQSKKLSGNRFIYRLRRNKLQKRFR